MTVAGHHKSRLAGLFAVPALLVMAGAVLGALYLGRSLGKPFDPLYFPGQHVATSLVRVGQDVTVIGTRCNRSSKPVVYSAVKSWVSVNPPGSTILVGPSSATEQPGCTNFTFLDPMPPLVISRTEGLLSMGGMKSVTWRITATDTPQGRGNAKSVTWSTTPIVVVP